MDEIYRGYRIAISPAAAWRARITSVRGSVAPLGEKGASEDECLTRARTAIDRYLAFLAAGHREPDSGRLSDDET